MSLQSSSAEDVVLELRRLKFRLRCGRNEAVIKGCLAALEASHEALHILHADISMLLGRAYLYEKKYDRATEVFAGYLERYPFDPRAWYFYGRTAANVKDYHTAITRLTNSVTYEPFSSKYLVRRALVFHHAHQDANAQGDLRRALSLTPTYVKACNAHGIILHGAQNYNAALDCYALALELDCFYVKSKYNRANLQLDLRNYKAAIVDFTMAISIHPLYADAYFNRGTAYQALKNWEDAEKDYRMAATIQPTDFEAWVNVGASTMAQSKFREAEQNYAVAAALAQSNEERASCMRWRATCCYWLEDYEQALEFITEAIRLHTPGQRNSITGALCLVRGLILRAMKRMNESLSSIYLTIRIRKNEQLADFILPKTPTNGTPT